MPMTRSACDRLDQALARIDDPKGEGARACLTVYREAARAAAEAADARAKAGVSLGPMDGAIVSIKDLFDVAGEVTRAGSKAVAAEGKPATADAPPVRALRRAGAIIVAKTNMSEFAFSGIGANPHYGTPANPADRARVPGGSSSGGAVAAGDGMCDISIGSDTGGSTRIPAAFCGIVGYKPSRLRITRDGAYPLSYTLDSIGPMARSVADCQRADHAMASEERAPLAAPALGDVRVAVATGMPAENLDDIVSNAYADALARLTKAGTRLRDKALPLIDRMIEVNKRGGVQPAEAFTVNRDLLDRRGGDIDPNIRARLERARSMSAADYIWSLTTRAGLVGEMDAWLADTDVLVMPTCPIVAPTQAEVAAPDEFARKNAMALRNTSVWNFFDCCAISLPIPGASLPVGLMLVSRNGRDRELFAAATAAERALG
jgi:aspartyl-tRNA(Asn)/glutamyl-tRNA(Gln) amidotransferase subunit A